MGAGLTLITTSPRAAALLERLLHRLLRATAALSLGVLEVPGLIIPRFPHRRLERGSLHRDVIGGLLVVLLLTGALRGELSVAFAHPIRLLEAQLKVKPLLGDLALPELLKVSQQQYRLHLSWFSILILFFIVY